MTQKGNLTVGNCTMKAFTAPVDVILDEFNVPSQERFRILGIEGFYLFTREAFVDGSSIETEFKCFLEMMDAVKYLEMYGIEVECHEQKETARDHYDRKYD